MFLKSSVLMEFLVVFEDFTKLSFGCHDILQKMVNTVVVHLELISRKHMQTGPVKNRGYTCCCHINTLTE